MTDRKLKKILFWGPAPYNGNESWCPFVASRIYELKKQGIDVEVVLPNAIHIARFIKSNRKGALKILAAVKHLLEYIFSMFTNGTVSKKIFSSKNSSYVYYDCLQFSSWNKFYKWFQKNNFDLINAHFLWFAEDLPFIKEKFGIPYIITAHGSDVHETPFLEPERAAVFSNILNNADKAVFVSDFLRSRALEFGYEDKNSTVIYNGYNSDVFYLKVEAENFHKFPTLGFVGHPISVKRAEILPDVLYEVQKKLPDARLIILGSEKNSESDLIPEIKAKVSAYGLDEFVKFIPEVSPEKVGDIMRQIDILLLPSMNEGFPCVAIEAQACGVCVAGSSNGGVPEAVGKNGICVKESENFIKDFSDAVIELWENPAPKENIIMNVREFTWEKCVEKEINVYNEITRNKKQETRNKKQETRNKKQLSD